MPRGIYQHKSNQGFQNKKRLIEKICPICQTKFKTFISVYKIYCSRKCVYKSGRHKLSKGNNSHIFKRLKSLKCICITCKKEFLVWQSAVKLGQGKFCSKECYAKDLSKRKRGNKSPFWKDGKSRLRKTKRQNAMRVYKYKHWRREVFKRDKFTCQDCNQYGFKPYKLNAHHIKSWANYPKLRYVVSNGKTLCKNCHIKYKRLIY